MRQQKQLIPIQPRKSKTPLRYDLFYWDSEAGKAHRLSQNLSLAKKAGGDNPHLSQHRGNEEIQSPYLTTEEASKYFRISVSALLKIHDLPYLKGCPNKYNRKDLDEYFERHKWKPKVA